MAFANDTLTISLPFRDGFLDKRALHRGVRTLLNYADPTLTQPELRRVMHSAIQLRDIRKYDGDDFDREPVYSE